MGNCSCNPHSENELNIETNPNLPKRNPSHFKQQPSLDQVTLNSNIDIIDNPIQELNHQYDPTSQLSLPVILERTLEISDNNQMKDKENSIVNKGTNNNNLNNNNSNLINPTHQTEITNTIYNTYNGINTASNYNFEIEENNQLQIGNDNHNNDNNNSTNNNNNNFTSNENTINNKQLNKNTVKLFQNNSNVSNTELINNIAYLNECFISKNNDNDIINSKWKQLQITNLISNDKLYSENKDEIMFRGYLNKLVISHMFKNCSTSVEKFIILKRDQISLYKNKENFLLNYKPQHTFHLKEIINCKRINFSFLNIQKLEGFYFMYIELFRQAKSNEQQEDLIFNIIKREKEGKFFVLFSQKEQIVNEWIYIINYFKES